MSNNIIKIPAKNGVTYIYEDKSVWDKEKGYSTHKRKCIGKIGLDGNIEYNEFYKTREKVEKLEKSLSAPAVSKTTLVGQKLIIEKAVKETALRKTLKEVFSKDETENLIALASYFICRGKALSNAESWCEDRAMGSINLASQRVSEILKNLDDDKVNTFFKSWIALQAKGGNQLFDITSICTYGKDNSYAERGYNRDHENLEQINLSLLTSAKSGLPLWYSLLPGSMSDRIVLDFALEMLNKFDINTFTFFSDRGFYSDSNLKNLTSKGIKFTIPVPSSVKWQKEMISEHKLTLRNPQYVIEDKGSIIYGKTVYKMSEYGRTWYHIYFDPARKETLTAAFMQKLQRYKEELDSNKPIEEHKSTYDKYFTIKETPKRGKKVSYNQDAIDEYLNSDSCFWILMSTSEKDTTKALLQYRERNDVELHFDDLKNLADLYRLRNHNEKTIKGKLFIGFLALVILYQLRKDVNDIPKKKRHYWSVNEMLDKVDTYSQIHFIGKYKDIYTVPTANQRTIFDLLNISYSFKGKEHNGEEVEPDTLEK